MTNRLWSQAGMALATVLSVIAMAVIITFAMAGTAVFHLRAAVHTEAEIAARDLAESVVSLAVQQFQLHPQLGFMCSPYGPNPVPGDITLTAPEGYSTGTALVTFNQGTAAAHNMVASVNNNPPTLPSTPSSIGVVIPVGVPLLDCLNSNLLPAGTVLICGQATVNGVTANVHAVLDFPNFPFAAASNANLHASPCAIFHVVGVPPCEVKSQSICTVICRAVHNMPVPKCNCSVIGGNVGSQATITLSKRTEITGTAFIKSPPGSLVIACGARQYACGGCFYLGGTANKAVSVAPLNVTCCLCPLKKIPTTVMVALCKLCTVICGAHGCGSHWVIPGCTAIGGALKITPPTKTPTAPFVLTVAGKLHMGCVTCPRPCPPSDGYLYLCNGSLCVSGGLSGIGAIVVTNCATIKGNGKVTGPCHYAVVSGGNMVIQGGGGGGTISCNRFAGTLYSNGQIVLNGITVLGEVASSTCSGTGICIGPCGAILIGSTVGSSWPPMTFGRPSKYNYGCKTPGFLNDRASNYCPKFPCVKGLGVDIDKTPCGLYWSPMVPCQPPLPLACFYKLALGPFLSTIMCPCCHACKCVCGVKLGHLRFNGCGWHGVSAWAGCVSTKGQVNHPMYWHAYNACPPLPGTSPPIGACCCWYSICHWMTTPGWMPVNCPPTGSGWVAGSGGSYSITLPCPGTFVSPASRVYLLLWEDH